MILPTQPFCRSRNFLKSRNLLHHLSLYFFPYFNMLMIPPSHNFSVDDFSSVMLFCKPKKVIWRLEPEGFRLVHPDSKNGLFSALKRILILHSVPDGKSAFWPFLALWALDHFLTASDAERSLKLLFWFSHLWCISLDFPICDVYPLIFPFVTYISWFSQFLSF